MQPGFEGGFNGIFCILQGGGGGERVQAFVVVFSSGDTHVKFTRVTRDVSLHSNYSQAMNKPTPLSKSGEVAALYCMQGLTTPQLPPQLYLSYSVFKTSWKMKTINY